MLPIHRPPCPAAQVVLRTHRPLMFDIPVLTVNQWGSTQGAHQWRISILCVGRKCAVEKCSGRRVNAVGWGPYSAGMVPVHWDPRGLQKAAVGSDRSEGEEVFRGLLASADHDPCRSALIVAAGAPRAPPEHSGHPARLGYVQSSYRKTRVFKFVSWFV